MNKLRQKVSFELVLSECINIDNKTISFIDIDVQFRVFKSEREVFLETDEKDIEISCIGNEFMRNDFGSWFIAKCDVNYVLKFSLDKMIVNNYTIIPIITGIYACQIVSKKETRSYELEFEEGIKVLYENNLNLSNLNNNWINPYYFHTTWEHAVIQSDIIKWNEENLVCKLEGDKYEWIE